MGPLKAELKAYLDVSARLSRRPKQIGGSIQVGGTVEVSIFGCGFGLSGDASLVGEGVKPFMIAGSLKVCVKILWKKYCGTFDFNWTFDPSLNLEEILILPADLRQAGKALNMHTGETFALWIGSTLPAISALDGVMVPMDSYIDLEFAKSVKIAPAVSARFGGGLQGSNFVEYFPPQRAKSDRVRHEYELDSVDILYHNGAGWVPYDMYAAATPLELAPFITADLSTLPYGYWQNQEPGEQRKLRIMASSPLNYLSQGTGDVVPEDLGITVEEIFCAPERTEKTCLPIDGFRPFAQTPIVLNRSRLYFYQLFRFRVTGGDGQIVQRPAASFKRAIQADANESIELYFLEAYPAITLHLAICANTAEVSYYERVLAPMPKGYKDQPLFMYRLIATKPLVGGPAVVAIEYDHIDRPVDKIVISTGTCKRVDPPRCEPHRVFPKLMFKFLQTLIREQHLFGPEVELSAKFFDTYKGVFFETDLYTNPNRPNTRYTVVSTEPSQLRAEITDDEGFRCRFELMVDPAVGGIDWMLVTDLIGLSPIPESGDTRAFTADIMVMGPGGVDPVRVRGRSCYPMLVCQNPTPGGLSHVGMFLNELVAANRLARPISTLKGSDTRTFSTMVGATGPLNALRIVTSAVPGTESELRAVVNPGDRLQAEMAIRGADAKSPIPFDRIRSLQDFQLLRAEGDRIVLSADAVVASEAGVMIARIPVEIFVSGRWVPGLGTLPPVVESAPSPCGQDSRCETLLYSVCVLRYIDAVENATQGTQQSVTEEVQTMIHAFNGSIQPIWRPYTNYAVAVRTRDTLYRENGSTVEQAHALRTHVFAFRTTGPLGHFHEYIGPGDTQVERPDFAALKLKDRQDEFKLKDFLHYVDFSKCHPNADGQLLNAKPLFYVGPRLRLFFLKPYVYEMARSWADLPGSDGTDIGFAVTIKDPAPEPAAQPDAPTDVVWDLSPIPIISTEVKVINNMITYGTPCANVTVISPLAVYGTVEIPDLRPQKLYTAIFNVSLKRQNALNGRTVVREVLRYAFQTSRYADFAQQVNSWQLKTTGGVVERAAVFTLDVGATGDAAALAVQVLADTLPSDHLLRKDFGDRFDRLMTGVFAIAGLAPAATTEFNAVRDAFSGRIFGILIRNPEPFNDPKMPDSAIAGTLLASIDGSAATAWKVLWSKDRSQAFVTNASNVLDVPAGASGVFTFVYKQWDGSAYAALSTIVTPAISLP